MVRISGISGGRIPGLPASSLAAVGAATQLPHGSALLLGAIYGVLHAIGPDHLGTVMSLSASAATPKQAFKLGASWSLGHSVGMALVAFVVMYLQKLMRVDVEAWEHDGDYIIGATMIGCGLYFILRENQYVEESGTVKACGCGNHDEVPYPSPVDAPSDVPSESFSRQSRRQGRGKKGFCQNYGIAEECAPAPVMKEQVVAAGPSTLGGTLLGLVQGLCCPMGLMGIAILSSLPAAGILAFTFTFLLFSVVGVGAAAFAWATLASNGGVLANKVSPRTMYRASSGFTVLLGSAWVAANFYGVLDKLNYAEGSMA